MSFKVGMKRIVEEKVRRLVEQYSTSPSAQLFWRDLNRVIKRLREEPTSCGEILYRHQHVALTEYLFMHGAMAVQFAVHESATAVFIVKITLSGDHPYPHEFESVLNEPSY